METCLNCGSAVIAYVTLEHGADFRPDVHGLVPETDDTIAECGVCREFEIVGMGEEENPNAEEEGDHGW